MRIEALYDEMYSDIRFEIRSFIEDRQCGVDNYIEVVTSSGAEVEVRVAMTGPFWIPRSGRRRR